MTTNQNGRPDDRRPGAVEPARRDTRGRAPRTGRTRSFRRARPIVKRIEPLASWSAPKNQRNPTAGEVEAGSVLGPAMERDQAGEDEREAGGDRERGLRRACAARGRDVRMIASASPRLGERDGRDECELDRPPAQGRSARIAAPESSPFGDEASRAALGDQAAVVAGVAARDEHDRRRGPVRASELGGDLEPGRDRAAGRRAGRGPGGARRRAASASAPFFASPTTVNPSHSSSARAVARKLGWSSTMRTVCAMRRIVAEHGSRGYTGTRTSGERV